MKDGPTLIKLLILMLSIFAIYYYFSLPIVHSTLEGFKTGDFGELKKKISRRLKVINL